jgi:hypothetical protein
MYIIRRFNEFKIGERLRDDMTKVAFIGKMFSGKTTAANILTDEFDYTRLAFADPVKEIAATLLRTMRNELEIYYGVEPQYQEWTYSTIQERKGEPQVRQFLQFVGTQLGREIVGYSNLWVDILLNSINLHDNIIVDDCRFANEAEALSNNGFVIVRVDRPIEDRLALMHEKYPINYQDILSHASELELDSFEADVLIYASNLEELQTKVREFAS